jgi:hypothetical protein
MTKYKVWQDDTVQVLNEFYQKRETELQARITALEEAVQEVLKGRDLGKLAPDNFDAHFIINIGAMRKLAALLEK